MVLRLLIDAVHADEIRVAIVDNGRISDFDVASVTKQQLKGNIYLAKITRVEPSLQAAFVEYGNGKQGFLPFSEIHPDYYQIPVADRERLLREAAGTFDLETDVIPFLSETRPEAVAEVTAEEPKAEPVPPKRRGRQPKPQAPEPEEVFLQAEPLVMAELHDPQSEIASPEAVFLQEVQVTEPQPERVEIKETVEIKEVVETIEEHHDHQQQESYNPENENSSEIETLASEEDAVRESRSSSFYRRYKIQEVIKRNQVVLVQVIKEERGNKGVSLTTYMSLAGRYCVLMPNSPKAGGISRKISSGEDRRRLKEISADLKNMGGMSAIIRTAGIDRERTEIKRDYDYLLKLWNNIREQTLSSNAPALIYEEGDIIKRTIRDLYSTDIEEVVVAGEKGFQEASDFLSRILPGHNTAIRHYQDNVPLFYAYNIEDQLNSMHDPVVKLRSGGYLVINPTEALISIDVNSGRATGERNIEETAVKTNLEAAAEVARQLRLRDLAGLIVIDFIDMSDSRNRRSVERGLKEALKQDRAKIQIGRISAFGLMEMSRQRLRPSISESNAVTCHHCLGKGTVRSNSSVALQIVRSLEKEAAHFAITELKLYVTSSCAIVLLNARRDDLSHIEQKYGSKIIVIVDDTLPHGNFRIEKVKGSKRNPDVALVKDPVSFEHALPEEMPSAIVTEKTVEGEHAEKPAGEEPRRRRNRRNRKGFGRDKVREENTGDAPVIVADPVASEPKEDENTGEPKRKKPRRWQDRRNKPKQNAEGGAENQVATQDNAVAAVHKEPAPSVEKPAISETSEPKAPEKAKKGWWRRIVEV